MSQLIIVTKLDSALPKKSFNNHFIKSFKNLVSDIFEVCRYTSHIGELVSQPQDLHASVTVGAQPLHVFLFPAPPAQRGVLSGVFVFGDGIHQLSRCIVKIHVSILIVGKPEISMDLG